MSEATQDQKEASASGAAAAWVREIAIVVLGALIASTLLRIFVVQMFYVPSGSMMNTLLVGDRIAVQKVSGFQRGDVVVFRDSHEWLGAPEEVNLPTQILVFLGLAPDVSAGHLVKRVIGVAGDRVACCDAAGQLTVNNAPLNEEDYLYTAEDGRKVDPSIYEFEVVVPAGHIFVMGDHRNRSQDSRCHIGDQVPGRPGGWNAFVPTGDVVGTVVAVIYPFDRMRGMDRPGVFEGVPDGEPPPDSPQIIGEKVVC